MREHLIHELPFIPGTHLMAGLPIFKQVIQHQGIYTSRDFLEVFFLSRICQFLTIKGG